MIQIKTITELPPLDWSEHALFEIAQSGLDMLRGSAVIFQLGEAAVCGLMYASFTSPPWFWFALSKQVKLRDLIDFRGASQRIPWGTHTAVKDNYRIGKRFAEFYGFTPTGEVVDFNGSAYHIYRKES